MQYFVFFICHSIAVLAPLMIQVHSKDVDPSSWNIFEIDYLTTAFVTSVRCKLLTAVTFYANQWASYDIHLMWCLICLSFKIHFRSFFLKCSNISGWQVFEKKLITLKYYWYYKEKWKSIIVAKMVVVKYWLWYASRYWL